MIRMCFGHLRTIMLKCVSISMQRLYLGIMVSAGWQREALVL